MLVGRFSVMHAWHFLLTPIKQTITFHVGCTITSTALSFHWGFQDFHIDRTSLCMELPLCVMEALQTFHMLLLLTLIRLPDIRTQCLSTVWALGGKVSQCHCFVDSLTPPPPPPPHSSPNPSPSFSTTQLWSAAFLEKRRRRGHWVQECHCSLCVYACACVRGVYAL